MFSNASTAVLGKRLPCMARVTFFRKEDDNSWSARLIFAFNGMKSRRHSGGWKILRASFSNAPNLENAHLRSGNTWKAPVFRAVNTLPLRYRVDNPARHNVRPTRRDRSI